MYFFPQAVILFINGNSESDTKNVRVSYFFIQVMSPEHGYSSMLQGATKFKVYFSKGVKPIKWKIASMRNAEILAGNEGILKKKSIESEKGFSAAPNLFYDYI